MMIALLVIFVLGGLIGFLMVAYDARKQNHLRDGKGSKKALLFLLLIPWMPNVFRIWPTKWTGVVTDNTSGKPVEGATISLVWCTIYFIQMDGGQNFLRSAETKTDMNGRFSLRANPGFIWNPLLILYSIPKAWVLKSGYAVEKGITINWDGGMKWDFRSEIPLKSCRSVNTELFGADDSRAYFSLCENRSSFWCTPPEAVPALMTVFNEGSICWEKREP